MGDRVIKTGLLIAGVAAAILIGLMAWHKHREVPEPEYIPPESLSYAEKKNTLVDDEPVELPEDLTDEEKEYYDYLQMPHREWKEYQDGTVSYRGKKYRRNTYVKAILGMGIDTHDDLAQFKTADERNLSDAIFLMAEDTSRAKTKVVIIPRDTIVVMDNFNENDERDGRRLGYITQAYAQLADPVESCEFAVKTISDALCNLRIDDYAAINLDVVNVCTDLVGGVEVTIPNEELVNANSDWENGTTHKLFGEDAERFIRYRNRNKDASSITRLSQHREFVLGFDKAVRDRYKDDKDIITKLYDAAESNLVSNMSKAEIISLGLTELNASFTQEDILQLPGHAEEMNFTQYYIDYEEAIPMILDLFYREITK